MPPPISRLDRRKFLVRGGAAVAAVTALAGLPFALREEMTKETSFVFFSSQQHRTISAVQEHLFPKAPDSPGATDIGAAKYLEWAITVPERDPDVRNTIVNGISRLQDATIERFDTEFVELEFMQKEELLRYLADETRWGRVWLSMVLTHIFEALLSDPVYGGNPDQVGWQWLEHQPGFPRPPTDKTYGKL